MTMKIIDVSEVESRFYEWLVALNCKGLPENEIETEKSRQAGHAKQIFDKVLSLCRDLPGEEELARASHKFYLEAVDKLSLGDYNQKAARAFDKLTEAQKSIDRHIAQSILELLRGGQK